MAGIQEEMMLSRKAAGEIAPDKVYFDPEGRLEPSGKERVDTPEDKRRNAIRDLAGRLMDVENSKTNPRGGWNPITRRWYPHRSHEGGADTIAYGIKLSNGGETARLAIQQGYLTDEQAVDGVRREAERYYDSAKKTFDRKYGEGAWDNMNFKQQSILSDFEYGIRGGLASYPKLMQAAYEGDIEGMLRESARYDAKRRPVTKRNKRIAEDIDTLRSIYPVKRIKKDT